MAQYQAIFLKVDGLSETDIDPPYRLSATERDEAEAEARALKRPTEANFIKLTRDGHYEPPRLGLPFNA